MEELSLLNELGFESHVSIGATVVLLSFIIKTLYTEHMQRFMRDAWGLYLGSSVSIKVILLHLCMK